VRKLAVPVERSLEHVIEALRVCVEENCGEESVVVTLRCSDLRAYGRTLQRPGVYVFVDPTDGTVYYVGQAKSLVRRLKGEHCNAHVGGSEGVVRFLMLILDEICERADEWRARSVKERKNYVKSIIRHFLERLIICVAYCREDSPLEDRGTRLAIEGCLKQRLNPILNP